MAKKNRGGPEGTLMFDISVCSALVQKGNSGQKPTITMVKGPEKIQFEDVASTGTPIRFGDSVVTEMKMDVNGEAYAYRRRQPIDVDFTFLPGSDTEYAFRQFLLKCDVEDEPQCVDYASITYSDGMTTELVNGILLSGAAGISAEAGNRKSQPTYRFRFAKVVSHTNGYS